MAFDLTTAQPIENSSGFDLSTAKPFKEEKKFDLTDPLSFVERAKFSFGESKGRKKYLENKFPSETIEQLPNGKFSVSGVPIDPEGFDIGDIADVADEIVRLGFQIKGAGIGGTVGVALGGIMGAPSGPMGSVAGAESLGTLGLIGGGATGRALGQGFVSQIGKYFGVREDELMEVAKDITKAGAFGAVGEIGGQLISTVSMPTVKFLSNLFDKFQKKFAHPIVQNIFNFTAGIDKNSIARVQQKGAKAILTRENMSEDAVFNIANKIQNGLKKARDVRGIEVGKAKVELANSGKRIDIINPKRRFYAELKKADILDDMYKAKDPLVRGADTARDKLINVKETLDTFKGKTISTKEALRLKDELDDMVKFAQEGKLIIGNNEERILKQLRSSVNAKLKLQSSRLAQADEAFSELARTEEVLKSNLSMKQAESFLKKVLRDTSSEFPRRKLAELDALLFKKDKFMNELMDVVAARDFASGTFRGIRSGLLGPVITGGLGVTGTAMGGPLTGLAGAGTGIAVSTPRTVGNLLKAQQALGLGVKSSAESVGKTLGRETFPAILEKLMSGKINQE